MDFIQQALLPLPSLRRRSLNKKNPRRKSLRKRSLRNQSLLLLRKSPRRLNRSKKSPNLPLHNLLSNQNRLMATVQKTVSK
jgi:hypothetical protein